MNEQMERTLNVLERDLDPEELEELGEEDAFDSDSQASSTQTSTLTWINWYTSLPGHDYFCEVHEDFIEDDFNLTGLQQMVPFWKEALEMVIDVEPEEDSAKIPDVTIIESSAELLYGLVHQRFILTKLGLASMVEKYEQGHFGACPRVFCHATHVLPTGRADMPGVDTVKLYCPNCGDIYSPPSSKYASVDGAFFGTTFAPLFFQTFPELLSVPFYAASPPSQSASRAISRSPSPTPIGGETLINPNPHGGQKIALGKVYVPRIYGFKVSERARNGPRMKWLRERPERWEELDNVDWKGRFKDSLNSDEEMAEDDDDEEEDEDEVGAAGAGAGVKGKEKGKKGKAGSTTTKLQTGKKGKLFDDEEDDEEDDDDEEEEEEAVAPTTGQSVKATTVVR